MLLKISDWSTYPIGRTVLDGPTNGSTYRDTILIPAIVEAYILNETLEIDIRNVNFSASWLEEVFYNIIKNSGVDENFFNSNVKFIKSSCGLDNRYFDIITRFLQKLEI